MPSVGYKKCIRLRAFNEMKKGSIYFTRDQLIYSGLTDKQIYRVMGEYFEKNEIYIDTDIDPNTYIPTLCKLAMNSLEFCSMYNEICNVRKIYARNKVKNLIDNLKGSKNVLDELISWGLSKELLTVSELSCQDLELLGCELVPSADNLNQLGFSFKEWNCVNKNNILSIKDCVEMCQKSKKPVL